MPEARAIVSDRRSELADFLRGRRQRAAPIAGGASAGKRRRTPGLRREELAQLAGLSVDWYTRLEQGRDVNPSRETLEAIARVLKLDDDERGHLFYLARPEHAGVAGRPLARQERPEPAMARALEAMRVPALVISPRYDVLAWNRAACRLLVDFGDVPPRRRNLLWMTFQHAGLRARYADIGVVEKEAVAGFRFDASSYVGAPEFDALIADLLETSEVFRTIWARHEVRAKVSGIKAFRVEGRGAGSRGADGEPLLLEWHTLASTTASRQLLVYYTARAAGGPEDERRLAALCEGDGG
ncbi:XRE family transcriptional regulator [Sorangium cellulosum]|uniref:XRE family transcriptional regulator n=1 Tax=Sorangium cellulosum TaxID=56 RepID=A0A2L0F5Z4_SORCE|nr:helix-turn-helix transcriptional regulator [Sorangium cellulosum]AUX46963.1 XRE family transcriptional regulator [Sorangium cellulosum]